MKKRKVHLYVRFQLGNSFGNTKVQRKVHVCILGNSRGNTEMERKSTYVFVFN